MPRWGAPNEYLQDMLSLRNKKNKCRYILAVKKKKNHLIKSYALTINQLSIKRNYTRLHSKYSWLSLSRTHLSQMSAYLEEKIWSLPKHENLTKGKKYCGKEEKLLPRSNFSSFSQYFKYISNFKNLITYIFVKCG